MQKHIHFISVFILSLFLFICKAQAAVLFLPHANYGYAETCLRLGMTDTMRSGYVCEQKSVIDEMNKEKITVCYKNCRAQSCKIINSSYKTSSEKSSYEMKGYNCTESSEKSISGSCYKCDCDNGNVKNGYCLCSSGYSRKQVDGAWSCVCEAVDHKELINGACRCSSGYVMDDKNNCICDGSVNKEIKADGSCGCIAGTAEQSDGSCKKVECLSGYYLDNSTCMACPEGSYSEAGSIGIDSCEYCPEGYTLGLGNCEKEEHPEGFEYSNAVDSNNMPIYLGNRICGKCEEKKCTEPYGKIDSCSDDTKALFYNGEYAGNTACGACIQIKCAEGKIDYEACYEESGINYGAISAWVSMGSLVE